MNGNVTVGSGIKFSDNTTQSSAAPGNALVWDYVVTGSSVTAVTSPTLDGNADGGYELEFIVVNGATTGINLRLYYNNDLINTDYGYMYQYGGPGVSSTYANDALFGISTSAASGGWTTWNGRLFVHPNGIVTVTYEQARDDGYGAHGFHRKYTAVSGNNLSRIDLVSTVANGIGVNSRFRLWRKR